MPAHSISKTDADARFFQGLRPKAAPSPLSLVEFREGQVLGNCRQSEAAVRLLPARVDLLAQDGQHVVHVPLHPLDLLLHVQDDLDAGKVDAQVPRQRQDDLQPLDRVRVIEPGPAFRAHRAQEALALVEPKGLGMDREALRDRSDPEDDLAPAGGHRDLPGARPPAETGSTRSDLAATILNTPALRPALSFGGSTAPGTTDSPR